MIGLTAIVVLMAAVAWVLRPHGTSETSPVRVEPLTMLSGWEDSPAFSPDGEQVAFVWNGEKEDNADIYVKIVGSSEVRRLTTDPAPEFAPRMVPLRTTNRVRARRKSGTQNLHDVVAWRARSQSERFQRSGRDFLDSGRRVVGSRTRQAAHSAIADSGGIYLIPVQAAIPANHKS